MKRQFTILSIVLLLAMVLSACAPAATPTAAPVVPTTPPAQPTAAPVQPTAAPTTAMVEPTTAPATTTTDYSKVGPELAAAFTGKYTGTTVTMAGPFTDQDAVKFDEFGQGFREQDRHHDQLHRL